MTQYSPQQPYPNYYPQWGPPVDPLKPAKRAGTMLFVIGAIAMLLGVCMGLFSQMPLDQMPPAQLEMFRRIEAERGISIQTELMRSGIIVGGLGIAPILLGLFVRRGGLASIFTALILLSLATLLLAFSIIVAFTGGMAGAGMLGLCLPVLLTSMLVVNIILLVRAAYAAPGVRMAKDQYAAQYWQYQQQQQAYAQQGYGYPPQGAPPSPVPPPPLLPQNPPSQNDPPPKGP